MIPRAIRKKYVNSRSVYSAATYSLFRKIRAKRRETTRKFPRSSFFFKDADNNDVFKIFRNLFAFPHPQNETEQAALQRKATTLTPFVWDVVRTRGLS